ncbi:hypothetical protein SKAU_G00266430 [Synaphobranchus kaupii]|uniref:Uncharacterized protein n=1 Tax=Synaphobranchus kaupii TaxID=118154 RepID=A0A9Q1EZA9_SYNKA|nr:hypothetical protein SKAU_G00266430 [Synaphobranchus kaupii]
MTGSSDGDSEADLKFQQSLAAGGKRGRRRGDTAGRLKRLETRVDNQLKRRLLHLPQLPAASAVVWHQGAEKKDGYPGRFNRR